MIKKDIKFFNYETPPREVTKSFYFNYTRLEGAEIELQYGDLEETIEELNQTEDVQKAYGIFKELITGAVGMKSDDGMEFIKSEEITQKFTNSPAMSVLIWSFIEDPESAGPFLEGMLPAKDVADGRARLERKRLEEALAAQQEKTPRDHIQAAPESPVLENEPKEIAPRDDEQILAAEVSDLTNEELARLVELRRSAQS